MFNSLQVSRPTIGSISSPMNTGIHGSGIDAGTIIDRLGDKLPPSVSRSIIESESDTSDAIIGNIN